MYTGKGFEVSELGDVDVFLHKGLFHLFHLVLPNHDYIAHAVSSDGFLWRRVKNPLFIGEPGDWDDDMVWTMHVSEDSSGPATFRMFYTGISRKEDGRIQRIGLARSSDLYHWEKVNSVDFPLSISGKHYETDISEGRHWVSCRDPYFFKEDDTRILLVNARVSHGPKIRRGCVGLAKEIEPDQFEWCKPLFFPGMYDDIEVPGLHKIRGKYYLIGNIKEDIKVHYWCSENLFGEYESFSSNLLLPKGNYAARVIKTEDRYLLWNFFTTRDTNKNTTILPPPAELNVDSNGALYLTSYERFSEKIKETLFTDSLFPLTPVLRNSTSTIDSSAAGTLRLESVSGYEIFFFKAGATDFRLKINLAMEGRGKTGFIFRADEETNGHYIALDLVYGYAEGRIWGERENGGIENSFRFDVIQSNSFQTENTESWELVLVVFGGYIELSINGRIVLRYVVTDYMDLERFGIYVESAKICINEAVLDILDGPQEEDHQLL